MERLVMYALSNNGAQFCMASEWEKVKHQLHGKVDYMYFNLRSRKELGRKIDECLQGKACPVGGGHLCLK